MDSITTSTIGASVQKLAATTSASPSKASRTLEALQENTNRLHDIGGLLALVEDDLERLFGFEREAAPGVATPPLVGAVGQTIKLQNDMLNHLQERAARIASFVSSL